MFAPPCSLITSVSLCLVLTSYQRRLEILCGQPKLDDEIAGEVLPVRFRRASRARAGAGAVRVTP
jgi:hypothetical protein